jgi:hypothetical protein
MRSVSDPAFCVIAAPPNVHDHDVGEPVVVSVKATVSGDMPVSTMLSSGITTMSVENRAVHPKFAFMRAHVVPLYVDRHVSFFMPVTPEPGLTSCTGFANVSAI